MKSRNEGLTHPRISKTFFVQCVELYRLFESNDEDLHLTNFEENGVVWFGTKLQKKIGVMLPTAMVA